MPNKKVKFEQRPTCSCGVKMKLVMYEGYYEEFKYWRCDSCHLDDEMQDFDEDSKNTGAYA